MKNVPDSLVDPKVIQESIRVGMESAKAAMADIDINGIIAKSMAEAHTAMNSKEVKDAMANAKKEIAKAQKEMVAAQKNAQKQMIIANKQNKAIILEADHAAIDKTISSKYKKLVERMAADNLINEEEGFTIEKKDGVLKINDVKQSDDVYKKYADAFGKSENVLIAGKGKNLSVSINDEQ
ncbi:hypothetical protein C7475_106274 [Chitinophaga sp. S165]|nr:hypothetical protein C7475_106274 [Chitinophaga sp. S165]